jgi:NAD(P)-dependent dehydrogenase (short-subunit alcohol dehydrogenase family)
MPYVVTGGTGFIGRHLLQELSRRGEPVHVLVREQSRERLERLGLPNVRPLVGDLTRKGLGLGSRVAGLRGAEVFHLAAVYDLDADEEASRLANVEGTRHVLDFAARIAAARLHHMSSIAIVGAKFKGAFTEDMFDEGQVLDHPYYSTKFEAEKLVREQSRVPFRIYRPGLVIGSSRTGEADRTDGPYYAFKIIQRLRAALPSWVPLVGFEGGPFYLVPVDFVAAALDHIAAQPGLDGQTFHLLDPNPLTLGESLNEFCRAAHAPQFTLRIDRRAFNLLPQELGGMLSTWRVARALRRQLLEGVHVPAAAVSYLNSRARFRADHAEAALAGSGISCPPLHSYAWKVWDYWERRLDPEALSERNLEACVRMVEQALADHGRVDVLVNNAGRSIRRSFVGSLDRFHDYERTMRLNYFGPVRLMQAVVPGMLQRGSGHIVNISSIGAQVYPPRFGAYVASKSALASLGRCMAPELADRGVAITNIHMPLVRTPMIAPTEMYRNFPTIDTGQAAEMVMQALLSRPVEVSTRLGKLGEAVDAVSPGVLQLVMTAAYHAFPETAPERDGRRPDAEAEISTEAAAMAYLMRGIHF